MTKNKIMPMTRKDCGDDDDDDDDDDERSAFSVA